MNPVEIVQSSRVLQTLCGDNELRLRRSSKAILKPAKDTTKGIHEGTDKGSK